jgi:hypothetical protein
MTLPFKSATLEGSFNYGISKNLKMKRRTFIQHTGLAAGMIAVSPLLANCVPAEDCQDLGPCHVWSPKNILHLKYHNLQS